MDDKFVECIVITEYLNIAETSGSSKFFKKLFGLVKTNDIMATTTPYDITTNNTTYYQQDNVTTKETIT